MAKKTESALNELKSDVRQFVTAFLNKPTASNGAALRAAIEEYPEAWGRALIESKLADDDAPDNVKPIKAA